MDKTVAIIQARLNSSRLPGKVLAELGGKTMIDQVCDRIGTATLIDEVWVATTTCASDDPLAEHCRARGIPVFRGSESDVLDRYYQAALAAGATVVVRITGDSPLHDAGVIDATVGLFLESDRDYVANSVPPTFPDGLGTEVMSIEGLKESAEQATDKYEREHVTPYLRAKIAQLSERVNYSTPEDLSRWRWTVDEPKDLEFVRAVYEAIGSDDFTYGDVVNLLKEHPELMKMNDKIERDEGYFASLLAEPLKVSAGARRYEEAKQIIPGGTQLLSKRPEMALPGYWPAYASKASGSYLWDMDGTRFLDMGINGIGACILGYADPDVDAAVKRAIDCGVATSLNCPEEVELAELLCEIHPWADMARFCRGGGEAMAIAVRIARVASGKTKVAFSGYHGWHDWYMAANFGGDGLSKVHLAGLDPEGVPSELEGTSLTFRYNDLAALEAHVAEHGSDIGVIVCEPQRNVAPEPGFLQGVRDIADRIGAILIFDEVSAAWRKNFGGLHLTFGVEPDLAVFAKATSNGYAFGGVIGRRAVMAEAERTFISSTSWTERIGPAAALATIRKHREIDASSKIVAAGNAVQGIWKESADAAGVEIDVGPVDMPPISRFNFVDERNRLLKTIWCQSMLRMKILDNAAFYSTAIHHRPEVLDPYRSACKVAFRHMKKVIESGDAESYLQGEIGHNGFARLT